MPYKVLKLSRLFAGWEKQPVLFRRYWDETMSLIEDNINAINQLPLIQAAIDAANAAADAANAAAENAQNTADSQALENSLVNSYIDSASFTAPLLSADSSGNVTIASHTRVYGNPTLNPSVSVTGTTIATSATADDVVRIYYSDPSRAGGSVSFSHTIDPASIIPQSGTNHSVGSITIPSIGTNDGNYVKPPGYVEP